MLFSALRWPDLVHDGVQDEAERGRHDRFLTTRLILGACGLVCLPLYLALNGAPGWVDAVLAVALAAPIVAVALLSLTGSLVLARAVSAASFAGLVIALAGSASAFPWAALVFLLADPSDARLGGDRRGALAACGVSLLGLMAAVSVALFDPVTPAHLGIGLATMFLAGSGLLLAAGQALHLLQRGRAEARRLSADPARLREERALVDVVGDLVAWHSRNGEVLRTSSGAGRFIGAPAFSLRGVGLIRRVHVSDRPVFLRALSDAANGAEPVTAEFRLHLGREADPAEGERGPLRPRVIWAEMRAQRVAGAVNGEVVSIIRDVTAQRRHAEELEKARHEAERANELKGRFLATVTHELRTPLNAIIGFSELLAADHPYLLTEERRKEYATIIRDSGHHLLEVVNTLLDMSKIESGNFNFEPESFSLAELAASCCDLMQLRADQAGVTLKRQIAQNLPEIVADRRACRQVLINLVSNAVKFTPEGGQVGVCVQRDGDRLVLSVADTGIGIGEGDLPRLGDPFFQAGDAYRRPHEGTGLGLSVVRGLVGLHDGTLAIESGAGVGTTVTVTLPLAGCEAQPERKPVKVRTLVRPTPLPARLSA